MTIAMSAATTAASNITITPELVATYVAGTGDDNPWYRGDSPLGGPVAPALILHSAVYKPATDWYLPKIYGNLHARQEWENFAPVMVGDTLRARRMIVERYLKRDREYVVCEVIVTNSAGLIVSRSRTHQSFVPESIQTEGFAVDKSREKDPRPQLQNRRARRRGFRGARAQTSPRRCAIAFSGPARNYHNDRAEAIKLGFPEIVVQGMLSVCMVSEMMTRRFGLGWFYGGKMDVRLVNVVWGNDVTGPRGSIMGVTRRDGIRGQKRRYGATSPMARRLSSVALAH